ncbi:MAG: hypothetical protein R3B09_27715 [Nannocystaceae bacterium]
MTGALASGEAEAAIPAVLKPPPDNSRTMQFNFGFGPSTRIGGRYYYYNGNCGAPGYRGCGWGAGYGGAFKLHQEFMGHLNGKWYGPALGILTQEEFAGGYFGFNIAPRFTYDIHVYKPLALLVSPHISLGYHLSHWNGYYYNNYFYYYGSPNYHAADLQFGVAVKLMIAQRWLVWVQTPSFDFHMGSGNYWCAAGAPGYYCGTYFAARFDVLAGGGVAF